MNGDQRFRKPLLYPFELWGQVAVIREFTCLYCNKSSGIYYALVKRHGKQFRRSLKTSDRQLANRRLAEFRNKVTRLSQTIRRPFYLWRSLREKIPNPRVPNAIVTNPRDERIGIMQMLRDSDVTIHSPITIDIQKEYLSDLFSSPAASHAIRNLVAYIGELLSLGAVARIVKNGATIKEFKSPDEFAAYVNCIFAPQEKCSN